MTTRTAIAKAIKIIWIATVILTAWQMLDAWNRLPATGNFATHWDVHNRPNGSMSRTPFFVFWAFIILITNIPVLVVGPMTNMVPDSMINLPNKDYWLSNPERKAEAMGVMSAFLAFMMASTNLLLLKIMNDVVGAANGTPFVFDMKLFIGYMVVTIGTCLVIPFVAFRVPNSASGT